MVRDGGGQAAFPPGFSGIDPEEMAQLIRLLERGREDLAQIPARWRSMLAGFSEVDTSTLNRITEISRWVDGQIPQLERRRNAILTGSEPQIAGLRPYVESTFATPEEARRYGRSLAARLVNINNPVNYKGVLDELAANKYDPDVTAAFFAALGPEAARMLPLKVNRGDNERRAQQINDISDAFGTAISAGGNIDGFGKVRDAMLERQDSVDDVRGISKLVSHGNFAPDWLATVVQRQALDPILVPGLEDDSIHDRDGTAFNLFLRALGTNPAAARLAIGQYAGDYTPQGAPASASRFPSALTATQSNGRTLDEVLRKLTSTVADGGAPAKEMGRVFAAASGATDETDGQHSKDAAWFAYNTMTTIDSGFQTRTDAGLRGVPAEIKPYLAQIAGSYATEITEGANLTDRNADDPSSFGDVNSAIPGLNPMFNLSTRDTYNLLKTFADTDENIRLFNQGMGDLAARLKAEGVNIEKSRRAGDDSPGLIRIMDSLGAVAGLQLAAEEKVRGQMDDRDVRERKLLQQLVGVEFAAAGFAAPNGIANELLWETSLFGGEQQVGDVIDQLGNTTRVDKLRREDAQATLAAHYDVVRTMLDHGYQLDVTPLEFSTSHTSIVDGSGSLLSYGALVKDSAKLTAYRAWLRANGMGGVHDSAFGEVSLGAADRLVGAKKRTRTLLSAGVSRRIY
jgi:hypothetical protein